MPFETALMIAAALAIGWLGVSIAILPMLAGGARARQRRREEVGR